MPAFGSPNGRLRVPALNEMSLIRPLPPAMSDLSLEVLDLVKIGAPVQPALRAGATAQRDRVAKAFADAGEVPGATIAAAFVVAARALM